MNTLEYLKLAGAHEDMQAEDFPETATLTLVTNFTDNILQKLLTGLLLEEKIYPKVFAESYKQYHLNLQNPKSELFKTKADITYFVFDVTPYARSEFTTDSSHFDEIISGIEAYALHTKGQIVVATFPLPYESAYGNLTGENALLARTAAANERLAMLTKIRANISLLDLNRLLMRSGQAARDMRGLYAFDVPFTNHFSLMLARECASYLFALRGKAKKCIVLDLDNTLWGGVVGEVGTHEIELGPDYPGLAYQNFQRVLLSFYERGVIFAIASRNNSEDVDAIFAENKNMVLKKEHFASIKTNWQPKSENITAIAKELNIGLDSIVFLDDDAANREEVKAMLPMVTVPDLPTAPEQYAAILLATTYFNQLNLTAEDHTKGVQYAAERSRQEIAVSSDPTEYLSKLGIELRVSVNEPGLIPRLAQLSQKTNQFNLTTKRYAESDLEALREGGALLYAGEVKDKFGDYGTVVFAIVTKGENANTAILDTFLMSCRAMGRGVEQVFFDQIATMLRTQGIEILRGVYVPTPKNPPTKDFLTELGFIDGGLNLDTYASARPAVVARVLPHITIS